MNRRLLAAGSTLLLGVLLGRYWPAPVRDEAPPTTLAAPVSESAIRRPAAPGPRATPAPDIAEPSPAALAVDTAILWPQAQRLLHCTKWNRDARLGAGQLDPESMDADLQWVDGLIDGAAAQWRAQTRDEQRAALLQHWGEQINALCAPLGESDEDTLYRSARDAALLGPREARLAFIKQPPLPPQMARRLDLWGDWVDASGRLLDDMAAHGDAEALFLRGIALGFDKPPMGIDGALDFLAPAIDNDPVRAYHDLRAYLASGDTRWATAAQALLQKLGERVGAAQRAAIDAEFTTR
jgi:hypothetical protein